MLRGVPLERLSDAVGCQRQEVVLDQGAGIISGTRVPKGSRWENRLVTVYADDDAEAGG